MTAASTVQSLPVYLRLPHYSVVALRPELGRFVSELREALAQGVLVSADEKRGDFYDIELAGGSLYIHVYRENRIVYLVARLLPDQQEVGEQRGRGKHPTDEAADVRQRIYRGDATQ